MHSSRSKFLAAILLLLCGTLLAQQPAPTQENFDKHIPLRSGGSLTLENDRGTISVEAWDKPEVYLEVHKYYEGSGDRDEWMRETEVRISGEQDHTSIKVHRPERFCMFYCGDFRAGVDLKLHVPKHLDLKVTSDRCDVAIRGTEGAIQVAADRSPLIIDGFSGSLRIENDRGRVEVRDTAITSGLRITNDRSPIDLDLKQLAGDSRIENDRSSIDIAIPAKTGLSVEVHGDRRSGFHSDLPLTSNGRFDSEDFSGTINGGGTRLELHTDRGSISLRTSARY